MAAGDIVEYANNSVVNTAVALTFASAPSLGQLIVLFCSSRDGSNTVSVPPSGFTPLAVAPGSAGYPVSYAYGKIAGESEGTNYGITWTISVNIAISGYVFDGPLTLDDISIAAVDSAPGLQTDDIPDTPLTTSGPATAVAYCSHYQTVTSLTYDNLFTKRLDTNIGGGSGKYGFADKVITGPDSDIQTTISWITGSSVDGFMLVVEPAASTILSIQELSQSQGLDSASLTQHSVLGPESLTQPQVLDAVSLAVVGTLNVDGLQQGQTVELVALAQHNNLAPADLTQDQTLGLVSLTEHHILAVASTSQVQVLDQYSLNQHNVLVVSELIQQQILDQVDFGRAVGWLRGEVVIVSMLDGVVSITPELNGSVNIDSSLNGSIKIN